MYIEEPQYNLFVFLEIMRREQRREIHERLAIKHEVQELDTIVAAENRSDILDPINVNHKIFAPQEALYLFGQVLDPKRIKVNGSVTIDKNSYPMGP